MPPFPLATPEERFWRNVEKQPGGCWLWHRARKGSVYGQFRSGGRDSKMMLAHRFSYELHYGPIPAGQQVRHTCDTPLCVNPDHLVLGSHGDNMRDRQLRGRGRCKPGCDCARHRPLAHRA